MGGKDCLVQATLSQSEQDSNQMLLKLEVVAAHSSRLVPVPMRMLSVCLLYSETPAILIAHFQAVSNLFAVWWICTYAQVVVVG